ncbi:hypothetical protein PAXRUDRAFT_19855 [Paxillus rubicundulus Ve08.2h10]|uniref:Uncharacterized protein n=1 Tax=Paxillus rubicundulus Ve08.2h10 TaxID=930991 RepID=A0A0D0D3G8_9AGAM|nr:hypothetical protein PAXRUDRAFT_19855 [Paxillus rubicundulus Ve08.2h10]
MSSALRTIWTMFQTAGEFTKCGVQDLSNRLIHLPVIPEHRASIKAQVMASASNTQPTAYAPYPHFHPWGDRCADTANMNRGTLHTHQMSQSPPATTDSPEDVDSSDTDYQTGVTPSRSRNARSMHPHSLHMMSPQSQSPIALCTWINPTLIDTSIPMDQDTRPAPPTLLDPPSGEGNNPPQCRLRGDHPFPATTVPVGGPSTLPMPPQGSVPMDEDPTPTPLTPVNPPQGDHPLPTTTVPMGGPNPPNPPQCSAPMERNPVLPHQTNSTPSGARPSLPGHYLCPLTAEIVEPTVQGIVNACIPRLAEFIESQFAIQSDHYLKSGLEHSAEDSDGDNEEDNGGGSPLVTRGRNPSSLRKTNCLHEAFRSYLQQMKVIPSRLQGDLPTSAPHEAVHTFNRDGISPPSLPDISLDWSCSLLTSSCWNSEALALLSLNFYEKLKGSSYRNITFCEKDMNLAALRKLCEQKLARTHQAHQKQAMTWGMVSGLLICLLKLIFLKTLARWIKITVQNRSRDPEKWDVIQMITQRLDVKGMSGDETDYILGTKKVVRRIELPWISPVISNLFKSVESYQSTFQEENMLEKVGNTSLERHLEVGRKVRKAAAIPGLPCNWYNDEWFQGLSPGARSMLSMSKDVQVPSLELYGGAR